MLKIHTYGWSGVGFPRYTTSTAGWTEEFGLGVRWSLSVSLPLLKTHLASDGFRRLRFKGQVRYPLPSFSFYHPTPPFLLLRSFFPLFRTSPTAPQNPHLEVLSRCRLFRYSRHTHTATHSHSDIAHPRGRGTGLKCLMLWFQGDSVTAAKGRNRCASLRFN